MQVSFHARVSSARGMSVWDQRVSGTRRNRENEEGKACGSCVGMVDRAYLVGELSKTIGMGPAGCCGLPPEKGSGLHTFLLSCGALPQCFTAPNSIERQLLKAVRTPSEPQ